MQQRTRSKIALVFSALVFIAIGIGVFIGARRFIADSRLVAHTHEVISRIDEIQAMVLDAESAERGYLLTGSQAYLVDYQMSIERLPLLLASLSRSIAENAEQRQNVRKLDELVHRRLGQIQHVVNIYDGQGLEAARSAINQNAFRTTSAIREQVRAMVREEQELLVERAASSRRSADLLLGLAFAGIPFGLAVVASVYGILLSELRRRSRAERRAASASLQLSGNLEQLQRSSADLQTLGRYTGLLQSCANPEEALEISARTLEALLPEIAGSVYLLRASNDRAENIVSWGLPLVETTTFLPPSDCWAIRRGQPHVIDDLHNDASCPHIARPDQGQSVATACIPMSAQGVQIGFLFLCGAGPGPLPRLAVAESAMEQLSLALSNLRLRESLRLQSIRDPLTGLYNRRYLEESLAREIARCGRRNFPLSVLMLDVDHFKQFNDTHGHAGGDALLAAIGHLLSSRLRGEDIACRYGGEEFTVILPESDSISAMRHAEELRLALSQMSVPFAGKVLPPITASLGVATYPLDGVVGLTLLRKADAALYRAKRSGRNRVLQFDASLDGAG
ncbi:diguanylate cyclase [Stenotrophomonas sp. SY1]|jgi:diguanylate cyclase (GGDEF)-like protein|uniref:diguanylate cyclase n=1 Tax=Stenotrophomonas sp. SY1 TaxID=477235 RepID=UPI001E539C62|nr:diguanylate cyclase [Stenotrophomonas sp. SY1]MCD9087562.1 GGDEF domain-containing protein [Stenotrophomonas sp. SY1]